MKIKEKHIERLAQGKKSGINIGSRAVAHHLYAHEKPKYQRALKYRFLSITHRDRINLVNLWEKLCVAKDWDCLVLKNLGNGDAEIYKNQKLVQTSPLKEAKQTIKEIAS